MFRNLVLCSHCPTKVSELWEQLKNNYFFNIFACGDNYEDSKPVSLVATPRILPCCPKQKNHFERSLTF
uniref:Uncharacterized protein n=1 Tax=Rhizophora mucronata TaxID=61149 RepID=A0A2P2LMT9_RHIMU